MNNIGLADLEGRKVRDPDNKEARGCTFKVDDRRLDPLCNRILPSTNWQYLSWIVFMNFDTHAFTYLFECDRSTQKFVLRLRANAEQTSGPYE